MGFCFGFGFKSHRSSSVPCISQKWKFMVFPTFSKPVFSLVINSHFLIFFIYALSVGCLNLSCLTSKRTVVFKKKKWRKEVRGKIPGPLYPPEVASAVGGGICTTEGILPMLHVCTCVTRTHTLIFAGRGSCCLPCLVHLHTISKLLMQLVYALPLGWGLAG